MLSLNPLGLSIEENYCYFLHLKESQSSVSVAYDTGIAQSHNLVQVLAHWAPRFKLFKRSVILSLPAKKTFFKIIRFPEEFSDRDCEVEIQSRLPDYFPEAPQPLFFDYCFLSLLGGQAYYFLISTPVSLIQFYYEALKSIRLKIIRVEVDVCILLRLLNASPPYHLIYLDEHKQYLISVKQDNIFFQDNFNGPIPTCEKVYLMGKPDLCQIDNGNFFNPLSTTNLNYSFTVAYGLLSAEHLDVKY